MTGYNSEKLTKREKIVWLSGIAITVLVLAILVALTS